MLKEITKEVLMDKILTQLDDLEKIDTSTIEAMSANLDTLKKISKERIKDELCKTLMTMNPAYGLMLLEQSGALTVACPF